MSTTTECKHARVVLKSKWNPSKKCFETEYYCKLCGVKLEHNQVTLREELSSAEASARENGLNPFPDLLKGEGD